ncbi:DUF4861 domain-containing protein [Bacteroides acidifaciens]|uniref:DUF4861 domain-containing protein n=1 Tax=Bacteroides acidifaciens TaxID=85831 RepID=UPI003015673F
MKKIFLVVAAACSLCSCSQQQPVTVTVTNPLAMDRSGEMVEVSMAEISSKLQLPDTAQVIVLDENDLEVPYQVTYNDMLIFPTSVKASSTATYTIKPGNPQPVDVISCGRVYPERVDDIAWENDRAAYRAYGPALQATGERAYGYDVFTKRVPEPVVEDRYDGELNRNISYHVDHGNGMDVYAVGPTLGGGTAALMAGDTIIYPYCYRTQEILDNGPLRFTVKLEFNPLVVRRDSNVVETRVISLDAGSYLNKTIVSYTNLKEAMPVTTGLVLREPDGATVADAANGYITYVDPTTDRSGANGKIFVGAAFPAQVKEAKVVLFSEMEKKERGGADGHVLAVSEYEPGSEYTYYWGSAWDKAAIKTPDAWNKYMAEYAQRLRAPLSVVY